MKFKKYMFPAALTLCVILITIRTGNQLHYIGDLSFEGFLRYFFLTYFGNRITNLDPIGFVSLFTIVLLCHLFVNRFLYGVEPKYRSLLLLRYETKKKYLFKMQLHALGLSTGIIIYAFALLVFGVILFTNVEVVNLFSFIIPIVISYLVFMNLCSLLNIYLSIKFNDVVAICIVILVTFLVMVLDFIIMPISILLFGDVKSFILFAVIGLIIYFLIYIFMMFDLKNKDLL